jgi:hypothetical protein
MYASIGDKDQVFKWLNHRPYHAWIPWVAVMPEFKSLHGDPRFLEFVKKLNPKE